MIWVPELRSRLQGTPPPPLSLMQNVRGLCHFPERRPTALIRFPDGLYPHPLKCLKKNKSRRHALLCPAIMLPPAWRQGARSPPSQPGGRSYFQSGSLLSSQRQQVPLRVSDTFSRALSRGANSCLLTSPPRVHPTQGPRSPGAPGTRSGVARGRSQNAITTSTSFLVFPGMLGQLRDHLG